MFLHYLHSRHEASYSDVVWHWLLQLREGEEEEVEGKEKRGGWEGKERGRKREKEEGRRRRGGGEEEDRKG